MKSSFNYRNISEKLKSLYKTYHRLYTCYKQEYKCIKKISLFLKMAVITLSAGGTITTPFTDLATLSITGIVIIIQSYLSYSNMDKNTEGYKMPIHHTFRVRRLFERL